MLDHKPSASKSVILLWISIALYVLLFVVLTLWKYNHFLYDNLDLAIFNQVFFNTLNGVPFGATIHPPTYLGDHFSPIIYLLLPLYALWPGPQVLLIIETVVIGLTAIPIYLIARHILRRASPWLAYGIALLWLVNPLVHNMNFFEFELLPLAVFLLFWAIYFYLKDKKWIFALMIVLAFLVREDVALTTAFISIVAWKDKRAWFWKLFPIGSAVLYAVFSFSLISSFASADTYKFLLYYGWLGGTTVPSIITSYLTHPFEVIEHLLTWKNLEFILGMTFPFFFLVISPSRYAWLMVAPLAQIWLSAQGGSALILMTHYAGYFLVALFLIFILKIKKVESGMWPRFIPALFQSKKGLYLVILSAAVFGSITYGSVVPALTSWNVNYQQEQKASLVEQIPENAAVSATFELLSPLSTRNTISSLHYAAIGKNQFALADYELPRDTEYLAIDWQDIVKMQIHFQGHHAFGPHAKSFSNRLGSILRGFNPVMFSGSVSLWKKNTTPYELTQLASLTHDEGSFSSAEPVLTSVTVEQGSLTAIFTLPENPDVSKDYYLSVFTNVREFLLPVGYGLYPPDVWVDASELRMHIYLEPDDADITVSLFGWSNGFLKLSSLKTLEMRSNAEIIGEPITVQHDTP